MLFLKDDSADFPVCFSVLKTFFEKFNADIFFNLDEIDCLPDKRGAI